MPATQCGCQQAAGEHRTGGGRCRITGQNLGVSDTAGNVTLDQSNAVGTTAAIGTFAAQDTDGGAPGTIVFKDTTTGTLQTGVVTSSGVFTNTVTGVTSNTGNITLSTAGALALNQSISTGSSASGTVRLQANGDVDQAAIAGITAQNLGIFTAVGDIDLCLANNAVSGTFGATATTGGVEFVNSLTYATGVVTQFPALPAPPPPLLFQGVNGVVSAPNADITLISFTSLDVNSALTTTGTVRLQAAGDITQTAAGVITATALGVHTSAGKIDLENPANSVSTFSAVDTDPNQTITFKDSITSTLTIGSVAADADGCTLAVTGVASNAGNITLATAGALTLNQAVSTSSGRQQHGSIAGRGRYHAQAAAGIITANNLGIFDSTGNITLDQANLVGTNASAGTIALQDTSAGGTIVFKDTTTGTLQTGVVNSSSVFTNSVTGVASNAGDITLATAGALTLNQAVTTGSGDSSTVRLQAAGNISQAAAGTITALNLGVFDSTGYITLDQANVVGTNASAGTIAAQDTSAGGTIVFKDTTTGTLQTGVVSSSTLFTNTVTGVASNAGNITLATAGSLTLNQAVTTGSGGSSTAPAGSGRRYVQAAAGTITAFNLGVIDINGSITLSQSKVVGTNAVGGTFASFAKGSTTFVDSTNLTVGSVTSSGQSVQRPSRRQCNRRYDGRWKHYTQDHDSRRWTADDQCAHCVEWF